MIYWHYIKIFFLMMILFVDQRLRCYRRASLFTVTVTLIRDRSLITGREWDMYTQWEVGGKSSFTPPQKVCVGKGGSQKKF